MPRPSSGTVRVFYPRYSREEVLRRIVSALPTLAARLPLRRVVLFGSYAAGRQTAASDVDLLVVYGGAPREDAYRVVRQTLDLAGLEPHVYAESEAQRLAPVLERMTREGVVLYPR